MYKKGILVVVVTILLSIICINTVVADEESGDKDKIIIKYDQFFFKEGLYDNDFAEVNGRCYFMYKSYNTEYGLFEITDHGLVNIPLPENVEIYTFRNNYESVDGLIIKDIDRKKYLLQEDNTFIEVNSISENLNDSIKDIEEIPYQLDISDGSGYYEVADKYISDQIGDYYYLWLSNGRVYRSKNLIYWELTNQMNYYSMDQIGFKEGFSYYVVTEEETSKPVIKRTKDYIEFETFDGFPDFINVGHSEVEYAEFLNPMKEKFNRKMRRVTIYERDNVYYMAFLQGNPRQYNRLYVMKSTDLISWSEVEGMTPPAVYYDDNNDNLGIALIDRAPYELETGGYCIITESGRLFMSEDLITWTYDANMSDAIREGVNYPDVFTYGGFENYYEYDNGVHIFRGSSAILSTKDFKTFSGTYQYNEEWLLTHAFYWRYDYGYENIFWGRDRYGLDTMLGNLFITGDYTSVASRFISITPNDSQAIHVFHEGTQLEFVDQPFAVSGRTLMPVRALSEYFGFDVQWEGAEQKITVKKDDIEVVIYLNQKIATVDGEQVVIDIPPTVKNQRTYVPLRFICESLGLDVKWEASERAVVLN